MISVLVKEPGRRPESRRIPNTLQALQEIVGGYIEMVPISTDLCIVCNEEGKIRGLPGNAFVLGDLFVGTIILARNDMEGDLVTMSIVDTLTVRNLLPELWRTVT